jgi:putative ATPase
MLSDKPLAERMRPQHVDDYIGQKHLLGKNAILRKIIENKSALPSIIFWGPPGVGKTTLAHLFAKHFETPFFSISAINAGVKDVREIIDSAKNQGKLLSRPILFIDEIHRFSKSQQDALLGAVEKGIITLIGATTENPSFEVISALLSRCQVYVLKHLEKDELLEIITQAMEKDELMRSKTINLKETNALLRFSGGDARKLLNLFELVVLSQMGRRGAINITDKTVSDVLQQKQAIYDKGGEQHYDIISAFIKCIRGSDPNAAVYWLARMLEGGEDPKFIARRMLILSSEDIGNANPNAMLLAQACFTGVTQIGYPECDLLLSQTAIYLASSPKSNAAYTAIRSAQAKVKETGDLPVPLHLRNAPTKLMKDLGYGEEYQYAHHYESNFVQQEYLPDAISGTKFFEPGINPREDEMRKRLMKLWKEKYNY